MDTSKLRLKHGSKWRGGNRCTSVNLSQETKDAIDELVPAKYRSAWIERWCRLGIAIQSGEELGEWAEWFIEAGGGVRGWTKFGYLTNKIREELG